MKATTKFVFSTGKEIVLTKEELLELEEELVLSNSLIKDILERLHTVPVFLEDRSY